MNDMWFRKSALVRLYPVNDNTCPECCRGQM